MPLLVTALTGWMVAQPALANETGGQQSQSPGPMSSPTPMNGSETSPQVPGSQVRSPSFEWNAMLAMWWDNQQPRRFFPGARVELGYTIARSGPFSVSSMASLGLWVAPNPSGTVSTEFDLVPGIRAYWDFGHLKAYVHFGFGLAQLAVLSSSDEDSTSDLLWAGVGRLGITIPIDQRLRLVLEPLSIIKYVPVFVCDSCYVTLYSAHAGISYSF